MVYFVIFQYGTEVEFLFSELGCLVVDISLPNYATSLGSDDDALFSFPSSSYFQVTSSVTWKQCYYDSQFGLIVKWPD